MSFSIEILSFFIEIMSFFIETLVFSIEILSFSIEIMSFFIKIFSFFIEKAGELPSKIPQITRADLEKGPSSGRNTSRILVPPRNRQDVYP